MRPIDADNLIQYMEEKGIEDVIISRKSLEELKQLDVVEVVRCKDCKLHNYGCRVEQRLGLDGFCSYGERKDDEID